MAGKKAASAAGQLGQLAVEAVGVLEVRNVTDAVVPGRLAGWAGGEYVLSHRRKHDPVGSALRDEQRHLEGT